MSLGTEKPEHQIEQATPIAGRPGGGRSSKAEPLIRRVFYSPSELRAGWRLCIFLVLVFALIKSGNILERQLLHGADHTTLYLASGVMDFLILMLASWIMGRIEGRTVADYGLPWRGMFRAELWQGALLGFAIITCLLVVMRLAGVFYFGTIALHGVGIWKWGIAYVIVFCLVALLEEFSARGYALFTLSAGIGFWPAATISAVLFGYAHHGNSGEDWIGLFNVGLFGLLMCLLLRRTGNLWMPIGFHMAFDWGETFFYGVANSGEVYSGRLFNSSSSGSAWLSGGTVGPEGSVLYTLLLVVVWLICASWLREIKYPRPAPFQNSLSNLQ
jgi:membrane protease YdiL (CAAX protease family)